MLSSPSRRDHRGDDMHPPSYSQLDCRREHLQQRGSMLPDMSGPLVLPVVIPQQRPGSKERGFIAAYPPSLETCDISRMTFLQFIDDCNSAIRGNPVLASVQAVSSGVASTRLIVIGGVAAAIQGLARTTNKAPVRHKMNAVLDKYNEEVFGPRGLFCTVMKYEPEIGHPDQPRRQSHGLRSTDMGSPRLRDPVSAKIQGADNLPTEVAPLMYIDDRRQHKELLSTSSDGKKTSSRNSARKTFDAFNDYLDRRARARYAAENTGDVLDAPLSQPFKSRYLDPNHPATNGGLIGLLSGGALTHDSKACRRREHEIIELAERQMLEQYYRQMESICTQKQPGLETERQIWQCEEDYERRLAMLEDRRRQVDGADRHIKKGILFLTIVNRQSDADLSATRARLDRDCEYGVTTAKVA